MAETGSQTDRAHFLDGIRGWAALMVVFSHLIVFFLSSTTPAYQGWYIGFISDGNLAVFTFFVLSGFALSVGFLQTGKTSVITALSLRRYLRLSIPVAVSALLAYLLQKAHLFSNAEAGAATHNLWLETFYTFPPDLLSCLKFGLYDVFFGYDPQQSYNAVLWTMPIEFFGSFIVFSICALTLHLEKKLLILCSILAYMVATKNIFYLSFICGLFLAVHYSNPSERLSKIFSRLSPFALLFAVYYSASSLRGGAFGLPPIPRSDYLTLTAASLIVFSASLDTPIRSFFENRFSRYLGSISFPLYLTHFLVMCSFSSFLMLELPKKGIGALASGNIILASSVLLCFLVAHYFRHIEAFAISSARRFSDHLMR